MSFSLVSNTHKSLVVGVSYLLLRLKTDINVEQKQMVAYVNKIHIYCSLLM